MENYHFYLPSPYISKEPNRTKISNVMVLKHRRSEFGNRNKCHVDIIKSTRFLTQNCKRRYNDQLRIVCEILECVNKRALSDIKFMNLVEIVLNDMFHNWVKNMDGSGNSGSSSWIKRIVQLILLNSSIETKQVVKACTILIDNNANWLLVQAIKRTAQYGTNRMIRTAFNILDSENYFASTIRVNIIKHYRM